MHIRTLGRALLSAKTAAAKTAPASAPTKQAFEHVAKVDAFSASVPGAKACHVLGPKAALTAAKARATTAETRAIACGIAVEVNLATIEAGALVGVGQQVVGGGNL